MNRITALFSGQGSQYEGMGKKWILENKQIKQRFEQASDLLHFDVMDLCMNGNRDELQKTEIAQPAIFTLSYAMFEQFCSTYQPNISYLAGHSLGELTALASAGVLTYEDGLKLVHERGKAMSVCCQQNPSTMYAVTDLDVSILESLLEAYGANEQGIFIANYNTPRQTVLSGKAKELVDFTQQFKGVAKCIPLQVAGGFHSVYMNDALAHLKEVLDQTSLHAWKIPVLNVNQMRFYHEEDHIRQLLLDQMIKPVNWYRSLAFLEAQGTQLWLEFGPKNTLRNTVLNSLFNPTALSYDTESVSDILEEMRILEERNQKIPHLIGLCLGVAVSTQNNCQDEALYQKNVVGSYHEIKNIHTQVLSENRLPTEEEEKKALNLLKVILETKQISEYEQEKRMKQIIALASSVKKSNTRWSHS